MTYRACTIVARNYLAQAQVLARSFVEHHPDIEFHTLVVDGDESDRDRAGVGTVLLPADLGVDPGHLHQMFVMYDVMELATALKPALLMSLVRRGSRSVAYFDPDIRVYAPVHDVFATAEDQVVLTPHALDPFPRDGKFLHETQIMQAGIYNLGFIAVGASQYRFLAWWHDRLRTDAVVDVANGLFTDQKWIDWVPSLFPHEILRDRGLNVAYWNLHERSVHHDGTRWTVGGAPLRFFHFSGYDPAVPWSLSKHMGEAPRILLGDRPELARLCAEYGAELTAAGHLTLRREPYGLAELPNGVPLPSWVRRLYRDVVLGAHSAPHPPPDPWTDPDAFLGWLLEPSAHGPGGSFSVAELGLWHLRADLRAAFPHVQGPQGRRYRAWLDRHDVQVGPLRAQWEARRPATDAAPAPPASPSPARRSFGWSVLAYAASELGVGEAGRRLASAVQHAGVPSELVAVPMETLSRQQHRPRQEVRDSIGFENAICCVNADVLPRLHRTMRLGRLRGVRAGLWFWELEEFPKRFHHAFDFLDEVWVTSEFTRRAVSAHTDKPVRKLPLPITADSATARFTRATLGLPEDRFVFLTNFDYLSTYERKNPIGVIEAYKQAFSPTDGACLVVKSINAHHRAVDREKVRSHAAGRPDVAFLDDYVSSTAMKAMIERADVYVSLHRSEGYGLNMADAMAQGTPVVATGYSGNMDFMDARTASLVGYDLVEVGPHAAPYDRSALWAAPDRDHASAAMLQLFDAPAAARALAERARTHVLEKFSPEVVGRTIRDLLLPELADEGVA